jgi:hypothetical protein
MTENTTPRMEVIRRWGKAFDNLERTLEAA